MKYKKVLKASDYTITGYFYRQGGQYMVKAFYRMLPNETWHITAINVSPSLSHKSPAVRYGDSPNLPWRNTQGYPSSILADATQWAKEMETTLQNWELAKEINNVNP